MPSADKLAEANDAYFDERARAGDHHHGPEARKLGRRNVAALRSTYPLLFDEDTTEVLDYACGTGTHADYNLCAPKYVDKLGVQGCSPRLFVRT